MATSGDRRQRSDVTHSDPLQPVVVHVELRNVVEALEHLPDAQRVDDGGDVVDADHRRAGRGAVQDGGDRAGEALVGRPRP